MPEQNNQQNNNIGMQGQGVVDPLTVNNVNQPVIQQPIVGQQSLGVQPKKKLPLGFIFFVLAIVIGSIVFANLGSNSSTQGSSNNGNKSNNTNSKYENEKKRVFLNEARSFVMITDNMYVEVAMNTKLSNYYLKKSDDGQYKAMCVSLNGLVQNRYLNKDLKNGEIRGVVLIEVPMSGGGTKKSIWMTDGNYVVNGYEYDSFNDDIVSSDVSKIDGIIKLVNGKTNSYNGVSAYPLTGTFDSSLAYTDKAVNMRLSSFSSIMANGGAGADYSNIICINGKTE